MLFFALLKKYISGYVFIKIKTLFLQVENRIGKMKKTYQHNEKESVPSVAESLAPYGTSRHPHVQGDDSSAKEKIIKDTMSVDDYFDELISLVHEDYANL